MREVRLDVAPGLYVLRYVGSVDSRTAPSAVVRTADNEGTSITVVGAPGIEINALPAPGSSVVLVVKARGSISIALQALPGSNNLDAKFSLDLVAVARETASVAEIRTRTAESGGVPSMASGAPVPLDIYAHVSRRGDIRPDAEGWIAGPTSPSAIEGLEIKSRLDVVAVAAQYLNATSASTWSAWLTPGSFIGTRQRAIPLTGLRLKLVGTEASRFEISGEGLFLGSPKLICRGGEVELAVAGGLDPLVGLRIAVNERVKKTEATPSKPSRVRVFR